MACCFTKYACLDTTEFTEEENLYLLQLLDDVNSNRQLTDIFTFLMCRLPSVVWISFRQRVTHTHTQTLGVFFLCSSLSFFVLFSTVGGQSGKCVASYRAGKNARTSFLASARQRPWQTLKSALPNIIAAGFEETMDVCFAHALSLNFFTPSRTSQHTAKKISTFSSIDKRRLANGESFFSHPIYLLT